MFPQKQLRSRIMEKKVRKQVDGKFRNKERTKKELIQSIGKVLAERSYAGLNITSVSQAVGKNPKLIYEYFGTLDGLVQEYISQKLAASYPSLELADRMVANPDYVTDEDLVELIVMRQKDISADRELQALIHWNLVLSESRVRGTQAKIARLLATLVSRFRDLPVPPKHFSREMLEIISSGVIFLSVHAHTNGQSLFGAATDAANGQQRITNAVYRLLASAL